VLHKEEIFKELRKKYGKNLLGILKKILRMEFVMEL
jgi:hypothetical protein